jgi:2-hydroxycyclohexanecarboxyl-CoA dehydrogenase
LPDFVEGRDVDLSGKSIIVTGGASGIGRATTELLARRGARVIIGDIDRAGGAATQAAASDQGLSVDFFPVDLTDAASAETFVTAASKRSRIDGLVNAAGWDKVEPFLDNTPELWERLIAINLLGPIRLTRLVLPQLIEAKAGKIVNISSDAGRVGSMGETVYSATKGGIIAFTKSLAREVARYKINVNCVAPGPTDTPLLQSQTSEWASKIKDGMLSAIPFRRLATPNEIAEAIAFFLGGGSDYVTGQVLSVSGGLTMVD